MADLEIESYIKMYLLINDFSVNTLRKGFLEMWSFSGKKMWRNNPKDGLRFDRRMAKISYLPILQMPKVRKVLLKSGDINKWDIILLIQSIQNLNEYLIKHCKRSSKSKDEVSDLFIFSALLSEMRQSTYIMKNEVFESYLKSIAKALRIFKVTEEDLKVYVSKITYEETEESEKLYYTPVDEKNREKALTLKEVGNLSLKHGDLKKAISLYSEAIRLPNIPAKDQAVLYCNRSKAYLDLQPTDTAKASEDAYVAMILNPRWTQGFYRCATVFERDMDFEKAVKFYTLALGFGLDKKEMEKKLSMCRFKEQLMKYFYSPLRSLEEHSSEDLKTLNYKDTTTNEDNEMERSYKNVLATGIEYQNLKEFGKSADCYRSAVDMSPNKSGEALFNLAMMMIDGELGEDCFDEGIRLLEEAGAQNQFQNPGVSESKLILGLYHQEGTLEYEKAIYWYESAQFNWLAARQLAIMYYLGLGVEKNEYAATQLWDVAARHGILSAMSSLARYILFKEGQFSFGFEMALGNSCKWRKTCLSSCIGTRFRY